jgi:hypothetical protein
LDHGHLIHVSALTDDITVLLSVDGYIPVDLTEYTWTPINAHFVAVNDAIVSVNHNDFGILTVSDKPMGEIDIMAPIVGQMPASLVTITDFQNAIFMGAKTWTFHTSINDFFPIDATPANDSAVWVTLNGRRLVNGVDYKIVNVDYQTWDNFIWEKDTWESADRGNAGNQITSKSSFDTMQYEHTDMGVDVLWDTGVSYTISQENNHGIQLLIEHDTHDLLVATVFEAPQSTYAREFELFVQRDIDPNGSTVREVTLSDRYELIASMDRDVTSYKIQQVAGPFTRDEIKMTDFPEKLWLDKERVLLLDVQEGQVATIITSRGDDITSDISHDTTIEVLAPKEVVPESNYIPL